MTLFVKEDLLFAVSDLELVIGQPAITRWQRLETDVTALDLAPGLEARVADPLWLVGRQWQLAELKGEDAGTPIRAAVEGERFPVHFPADAPRGREALAGRDGLIEPVVEAESARAERPAFAAEAGLDFERALRLYGAAASIPAFRARFPFAAPADFDAGVDRAGGRFLALTAGRAIDGGTLGQALQAHRDADGHVTSLPPGLPANSDVLRAATEWLAAWESFVYEPEDGTYWRDSRLEYQFELEAEHAVGRTALVANDYSGGRLDWWSFDLGRTSAAAAEEREPVRQVTLPAPVRFPGMPAERYWEFEDGSVNLAQPTGGPASIAMMLVLEYELVTSNDWFQIPLELEYGWAFRLETFQVTDTFGRPAEIRRASAGPAGWAMFEHTIREAASDPALFVLAPVAVDVLESEPLEEVSLFRDEMANIVWGVERRTPGLTAQPIDRTQQATGAPVLSQRGEGLGEIDASILYRLQSQVPLNWFPFTAEISPSAPPGSVVLSRKDLRRLTLAADGSVAESLSRPEGRILGGGEQGFTVEEREVPRAGVVLTRTFQHARTVDGRRIVWMGRHKRVGHGEGWSNLRFDLADPVKTAL
jgi:hypothetical protein